MQEELSQTSASTICHSHTAYVCTLSLPLTRQCLHTSRVPIYSASSWASMMSLTAAFYVEPIRDIYEASFSGSRTRLSFSTDMSLDLIGLHHIYFLPTSDQLYRWRTFADHNDAWPSTCTPSLAAHACTVYSRHFRPSYFLEYKAGHSSIYLA